MSAVSSNPFAMLDDDDDAPAGAVAGAKETTKRTTNPAPKKDAPAPAAALQVGDKAGPPKGGRGDGKRPPKREFDRHSGTGRGARSDGHEEKKGGHGRGNWGKAGAADGEAEDAEPVELTEEEKAAQEAAAEERRKEAAAMTLEEYQKKQAKDKAEKELTARAPEKLDMQGLKVKEEDDVEEIKIGNSTQKKKEVKEKKTKELFTDVNFTTPPIETASPSGGRGAHPHCFAHIYVSSLHSFAECSSKHICTML